MFDLTKRERKCVGVFIAAWVLFFLINCALWTVIGFVVYHFANKYW